MFRNFESMLAKHENLSLGCVWMEGQGGMERDGPGTTDVWLGVSRERGRPTREYSHEIRVHSVPSDFSDGAVPSGMRRSLAGVEEEETRCAEEGRGPGAAKLRRCAGELRPHGRVAAPLVMKKRSGVSMGVATDAEEEGGARVGRGRRLRGKIWSSPAAG